MPGSQFLRIMAICIALSGVTACGGGSTNAAEPSGSVSNDPIVNNPVVSYPVSNKLGVATLSWTPPTENTDGSLFADLSGYRIYYGFSPGTLTNSILINNTGITTYVIENLNVNTTYYFSITSINSSNVESAYSAIVSANIPSGYLTTP